MYINFKRITIHNFMSFGDAEIELSKRGFTLISGQNLNPTDNAKSNGSGKSVIWDALTWCLTGETVRGVRGNLINLYNTASECFVTVGFDVDEHTFEVSRSQDNQKGSKLRVSMDGVDKSGKGIRDTEKLLSEYLPELTSNLIGSVIVLGQGLPCRFSNNTPSGRKEVLEKLSQSDFMIEDLKTRLSEKVDALNKSLAKVRGELTELTYKRKAREKELANAQSKLDNLPDINTLDQRITHLQDAVSASERVYLQYKEQAEKLSQSFYETDNYLKALDDKYNSTNSTLHCDYLNEKNPLLVQLQAIKAELALVVKEIRQLASITDVCPTCGQKIQGVHKPDTTTQHKRCEELRNTMTELEARIKNLDEKYEKKKSDQLSQLAKDKVTLQTHLETINQDLRDNKKATQQSEKVRLDTKQELLTAQSDKAHYQDDIKELKEDIESFTQEIQQIDAQILYKTNEDTKLSDKLDVVNKMLTLAKRDFRGFLLSGIIEYIDERAKEYSQEIFNTKELCFSLNGNNVDISYSNKPYENLSGGEKQKIDVIIQFALRDMLCRFSNFSSNILVLDELFDNLDAVGCQKVIDLITKYLTDVESIFIITHHTDISIPADDTITVIKDQLGVSTIR